LIFWVFLGSGIGSSFRADIAGGGDNYLEYFYPGSILLVILFASTYSAISLIEDRKEGFLLSVMVSPVSRAVPVLGKILGGTTLAFLQGLLFLVIAPLAGLSLNPPKLLAATVVLFLIAFALTSLGFFFAWHIDSSQGFHGVMNMVLFPMWLLSGALFPISGASTWVGWAMHVNPLSYGLEAMRKTLYLGEALAGPSLQISLIVTSAFGLACFAAAFLTARGRTVRILG
jgi:ABC-2 type transport system permease protein